MSRQATYMVTSLIADCEPTKQGKQTKPDASVHGSCRGHERKYFVFHPTPLSSVDVPFSQHIRALQLKTGKPTSMGQVDGLETDDGRITDKDISNALPQETALSELGSVTNLPNRFPERPVIAQKRQRSDSDFMEPSLAAIAISKFRKTGSVSGNQVRVHCPVASRPSPEPISTPAIVQPPLELGMAQPVHFQPYWSSSAQNLPTHQQVQQLMQLATITAFNN